MVIGWNDAPPESFNYFQYWFGKLARPHRFDDESCPNDFEHIGCWEWQHFLNQKYGKENVERVSQYYLSAQYVYQFDMRPFETDSCAYLGLFCNLSCQKKENT
jgi:hypothetical protein